MDKNKPHIRFSVNWLCEKESQIYCSASESKYVRKQIPLPYNSGGGWIEALMLDRGMSVSRATHTFEEDTHGSSFKIGRVQAKLSEPALVVHSLRSGKALVHDHTLNGKYAVGSNKNLFNYVDNLDFEPHVDCSSDIDVFILKICKSTMIDITGEQVFDNITSSLNITESPSASVSHVPRTISNILYRSLLANDMQGPLKLLYAEARILDYLCSLVERLTDISGNNGCKSKRKSIVTELHDELTQLGGKLPKLSELADRYGMSAKTLNETFKEIYGEPIVSFITSHRLKEAHAALEESEVAIKVLASRLGYSHVNHFTTAFRRKFGYPPGQVRK